METSTETKDIFSALVKARSEIKCVPKNGYNKFDRYYYSTLEDYVTTIEDVLALNGLAILTDAPECVSLESRETAKGGKEYVRQVRLRAMIAHVSGQWIKAEFVGEGQDRADKAAYKAITGGRKYELAALLNLATTDDPEADESVGQAEAPKSKSNGHAEPPPAQPTRTWQTAIADLADGPAAEDLAKKLHEHYLERDQAIHDAAMRQLIARVALLEGEGKIPEAQSQSLRTVAREWILKKTVIEDTEAQAAKRF